METSKTLHIFRAGTHITSTGQEIAFTQADLEACAASYSATTSEAPIVVGHPTLDAPAYGWVKSVRATPEGLEADVDQIDEGFSELVNAGRYKKISASFYPPDSPQNPVPGKYYLRHVGFLGAQPPAVKGLKQVAFSESDQFITIEDSSMDSTSKLDQILAAVRGLIPNFSESPAPPTEPKPDTHAEDDEMDKRDEQLRALADQNDALTAKLVALEKQATANKLATARNAAASFAESLVTQGKILPVAVEPATEILVALDAIEPVSFADGSAKPLANVFREMLEASRANTPPTGGDVGNKDVAAGNYSADFGENVRPDRALLDKQARELMAKNGISYEQAIKELTKKG